MLSTCQQHQLHLLLTRSSLEKHGVALALSKSHLFSSRMGRQGNHIVVVASGPKVRKVAIVARPRTVGLCASSENQHSHTCRNPSRSLFAVSAERVLPSLRFIV